MWAAALVVCAYTLLSAWRPPPLPPGEPPEPEQSAHQRDDRHGGAGAVGRQRSARSRGWVAPQHSRPRGVSRGVSYLAPECSAGRVPEVFAPNPIVPDVYDAVV